MASWFKKTKKAGAVADYPFFFPDKTGLPL
jgi:hypothetical protein